MRGPMLALLMLLPLAAAAHPHSARECSEGGDFIRNAARSRDTGTTREFFVSRLEEDLLLIRAFPPALRWFVFDEDDEQFLRVEVDNGAHFFIRGTHRAEFVERCTRRSERQSAPTV